MNDRVAARTVAALRDGTRVLVRPIESDDKVLVLEGFERLSEKSRYRRFLAPMPELSDSMLRYLTEVDHRDHEALVALEEGTGRGSASPATFAWQIALRWPKPR